MPHTQETCRIYSISDSNQKSLFTKLFKIWMVNKEKVKE